MTDPIPAATVVIVRDRDGDAPELLMVRRAAKLAFAGGAMVFPGGRVDPGDRALAAALPGDADDRAARVAAIRETLEEAGLPIGLSASADAARRVRAGLHAGRAFADLLAETDAAIDTDALVPFARWIPAHRLPRIFDTRFYLARLPQDAPPASVDRTETVQAVWTTAAAMLADAAAGRAQIIFPTRRNLERLAAYRSFAEAAADAARYPIRPITPVPAWRDGVEQLCIPDDLGYPVTAEPLDAALRG